MNAYVALLRGINVSGANKIFMLELKNLFLDLGLLNPTTYLQSGNVVFQALQKDTKKLELLIKSKINENYGYNIEVFVIPKLIFLKVYSRNPFMNRPDIDVKKLCSVFLSDIPIKEEFESIKNEPSFDEVLELEDRVIYMYCPNGFGRAKITNNFLERKLKLNATSRNWRTVTNIQKLLENI